MAAHRRQGPGRRPPGDDRRDAPARQAQAFFHAPHRRRRQRDRRQRREGGVHRPQARSESLLPLFRLHRRHQGTLGQVDPRRALPRAHRREGGRAHAAARAAGPQAARQPQGLQGPRPSARRAVADRRSTSPSSIRRTAGAPDPWPRPFPPSPISRRRRSPRRSWKPPFTCRSSTSRAAPTPPASARTRSRASGSSPARARRPSTASRSTSISRGRCCA